MAAIRCRIFRHAELSGPPGHRRVSLTPNHAELVMNPCFHTVCKNFETANFGGYAYTVRFLFMLRGAHGPDLSESNLMR